MPFASPFASSPGSGPRGAALSDASPLLDDDLVLKVTPPRLPRHLLHRARLAIETPDKAHAPVLILQAPAGFGKTSLLAQWRREHLSHGRVVAWVTAQSRDDPLRLLTALALAVRQAAGRPTFAHTLLDAAPAAGLEGYTRLLGAVAQLALDVVLMVDEVERLPDPAREALIYLLRNAPPNLRMVLATRSDSFLELDDLLAYGQAVSLDASVLRLTLDETLELVGQRHGTQWRYDLGARIHEWVDGWPLGLQLALTLLASAPDREATVSSLSSLGERLRDELFQMVLRQLDPADQDFLLRIAILERIHPALCVALTAQCDATDRLARLVRDTPVFVATEKGEWLRLHHLVREQLRAHAAELPTPDQALLHRRASEWLASKGQSEPAARHAFAAGDSERAYRLLERGLYESLLTRGRQATVLDWLERLPTEELERRPQLQLAAAWSLALSERHAEAVDAVNRLHDRDDLSPTMQRECALILGGAAIFADQPDRYAALHDVWADAPPFQDPLLQCVQTNRSALRALIDGQPALARMKQQHVNRADWAGSLAHLQRWGDFIIGLSYLWEGQVRLAENVLRPALAGAEGELGRRSSFATMLAALLAAAVCERGRPEEAAALLADRLDVLERQGLPEAVFLGYRSAARVALAQGEMDRALELLGALQAIGQRRQLPRLCLASWVEQLRIHAGRQRAMSCEALQLQIDTLLQNPSVPTGPLWRRSVAPLCLQAQAFTALARSEWRTAAQTLSQAREAMLQQHLGRLQIEMLALEAFALDRCGEDSRNMLREAVELASLYGLERVFADAHPALEAWIQGQSATPSAAPKVAKSLSPPSEVCRATPSLALTPKEREVLELLARSLSNKEIGRALQVGEETIKWHVKNLFAKLDAGTRKQVVSRARILGLLDMG